MLDLRRLRVLCEVARHGSFSAAADALGYTQPAISRQIATLEAETGATLVRRAPQGAVLTEAGRLLVDRATGILARLEEAELELRALLGLGGGRLRMASFASAASSIVPLVIMEFRERHPAIELEVAMADPVDSVPRLRAGEFDLVLSHEPRSALDPADDVEFEHLFDDPMYVALPAEHPLAHIGGLTLADFADEPWMLGSTTTCPDALLFRAACREAGFEPQIAFQHDDYAAVLGFVAAGVGIALIPDMAARGARDDVVMRAVEPGLPCRPIGVGVSAGYRSPAASAMLEVLRAVSVRWVAGHGATTAMLQL